MSKQERAWGTQLEEPAKEEYELSREEGRQLFDDQVRHAFSIGADEFLAKYDAGEFDDPALHDRMAHLEMLIPFYRRAP
ncbi:MAG: hypothetical protein ACR2PL_09585 [Dehalococcoidia bacterium]